MLTLAEILVRAQNPIGAAMLMLLSWIAISDGDASEEEIDALTSIAAAGENESALPALIDLARRGDIADLQLACEILRETSPEKRRLLLQMVIGVALADGHLRIGEGHIVRFAADLLEQSPSDLDEMFREITGHRFPQPGDPSSVAWWQEREHRSHARAHEQFNTSGESARANCTGGLDLRRLRDLSILGLDEHATADDIRAAYRRMAKVHHPDRFFSLGAEAVEAANVSFRRIQLAYERLTTA